MDIISNRSGGYTVVSTKAMRSTALSLKAKGLYAFIMSLPSDWDFSMSGIVTQLQEGEKSIRSCIAELIDAGYCKREPVRDSQGRFVKTKFVFYEEPVAQEPLADYPLADNGKVDKEQNKDIQTKDYTNKEKKNIAKEKKADFSSPSVESSTLSDEITDDVQATTKSFDTLKCEPSAWRQATLMQMALEGWQLDRYIDDAKRYCIASGIRCTPSVAKRYVARSLNRAPRVSGSISERKQRFWSEVTTCAKKLRVSQQFVNSFYGKYAEIDDYGFMKFENIQKREGWETLNRMSTRLEYQRDTTR